MKENHDRIDKIWDNLILVLKYGYIKEKID